MGRGIIDIGLSEEPTHREWYDETESSARLVREADTDHAVVAAIDFDRVDDWPSVDDWSSEERYDFLEHAIEDRSDEATLTDTFGGHDEIPEGLETAVTTELVNIREVPEIMGDSVESRGRHGAVERGYDDGARTNSHSTTDSLSAWSDRITETMPVEIVTGWATIEGIIRTQQSFPPLWYIIIFLFLVPTVPFLLWGTLEEKPKTINRWAAFHAQWLIAVSAFVVWVYYLGGPFRQMGVYRPEVGSILLVLWGITTLAFAEPLGRAIRWVMMSRQKKETEEISG